jgi:PAS domain S-box-containing protein
MANRDGLATTLFKYVQAGIIVIDATTHIIVDANPAACYILGADMDEILGSKCSTWLCPPDEECPLADPLNPEQVIENKEAIITRRDGSIRHVLRNVVCFSWQNRPHIIESLADITFQKEVESKYKLLEENAPVGVYEVSFETGKFIKVNELMCKYTGYGCDELVGMSVFNLLDDDSRELFAQRLSKIAEGEYVEPSAEYRIKTKDGGYIWVLVSVQYQYKDGKIVGARVVAQDIGRIKETEAKLREGERKLKEERDRAQMYLDLATNMFIALNDQGGIVLINREGCNILGIDECFLIGQSWFDVYVRQDYKDFALAKFRELLNNGVSVSEYDYPVVNTSGESRWIHWQSKTIKSTSGVIISVFSSGEDITEKRKMDNALTKLWSESSSLLEEISLRTTGVNEFPALVSRDVMYKLKTALKSII